MRLGLEALRRQSIYPSTRHPEPQYLTASCSIGGKPDDSGISFHAFDTVTSE